MTTDFVKLHELEEDIFDKDLKIEEYDGEYLNGMRHGTGKVRYSNGDKYSGEWRHNNRAGFGKYTYKKQNVVFRGQWQDNKKHGTGTVILPSGLTISIGWKGDVVKDNQTDIHFVDGGVFSGGLKNLERDGQGSMQYVTGQKYSGHWLADKRHGYGVLLFQGSMFFEGYWTDDFTNGHGIFYAPNSLPTLYTNANIDLHGRSKYFKDIDKKFRHYTNMKLKVNDCVWVSKSKSYLSEILPDRYESLPDGTFRFGRLNGVGFGLYGGSGMYMGEFHEGKR